MRILAAGLFLLTTGQSHLAALEWQTAVIHLHAALGQEQVVGVYPFRNTGARPVRILSVLPNCGCITATLSKEVYAPGEFGEIRVGFSFAGSVGQQVKTISVSADDAADHATILTLTVDIPEAVVLTPRFLFWRKRAS